MLIIGFQFGAIFKYSQTHILDNINGGEIMGKIATALSEICISGGSALFGSYSSVFLTFFNTPGFEVKSTSFIIPMFIGALIIAAGVILRVKEK